MKKRTSISILVLAPFVMTLAGQPAAQNLDLGTEAQQQAGKVLYDKYCAQCHGLEGDGEGYASPRVQPQPRDFTSGKFKIRTTPNGTLPTDEDLRRVIREGMPYTTMIGWPDFSDKEVDNIIYYLKTFSQDFENPDYYEQPIAIPDPPSFTPESAEKGREVYEQMGCRRCHGALGRGDGPSAPTLVNDAGQTLLPADLTKRWTFRGGPTRRDIYRTFTTGLNGTPMPSYDDSLTDEQRWQLVDYVYSLGMSDKPNYSEHVISKNVEDELDLARGEELFEGAESAFFPLVGQVIEPERAFHPEANRIEVRAVHDEQNVAFLLRWHDMRADVSGSNSPGLQATEPGAPGQEEVNPAEAPPSDTDAPGAQESPDDFWGESATSTVEENTGDGFWGDAAGEESAADTLFSTGDESQNAPVSETAYSDAVALQIPSVLPEGIRLPYFIFGDAERSVDIWFADLAQEDPQIFVGRGSDNLTSRDAEGLEMSAAYEDGVWTVIFKRERRPEGAIAIEDDQWYPIAFSVWNGWSEDRGNKRALSRWYYVYMEPAETVGPIQPMTKAALATLGLEIVLIGLVRRKYRNGRTSLDEDREPESLA